MFSDGDPIKVGDKVVTSVLLCGECDDCRRYPELPNLCAGLGAEGDGIDSNGYVVVNGGTLITVANPVSDSGLDSDCGSFVNGGTVVALGSTMDWAKSDDMVNQGQAILNLRFGGAQSSDEAIVVTDGNDKVLFAYDPDEDAASGTQVRSYSGAVVSSPALTVGTTCRIYVGGTVSGEQKNGVYDPATVKGFEGAVRQCYTGTTVGGFNGDRPAGGFDPDAFPQGGMERPEGEQGGRPQRPEGDMGGFGGGPAGGFEGAGDFGGVFGQQQVTATCQGEAEFVLREKVNAFSNVSDYRHNLQKNGGRYTCSVCGGTFADADGTRAVIAFPWGYVGCFLAGAVTASLAFAIVWFVKRKRTAFVGG